MAAKKPTPVLETSIKDEMVSIKGRVKKDIFWVLVSVAVAVATGLAAGQLI
ncbi:hypothetical protein DCCM_3151 [Desulfocucumis palustris]|uniref:Uncharacterized protein n=1 Tax=Desulfocucumis palustris TaxID=1898651 RepID=A0A2L2XD19_9FIRM|nr:hypothetical protein [Desulfocucumis palustris]GBF34040.1 hypothetical protein DCCM_3151 [Desulfocucumis palustris]